jgi:hypothetical protein
MATTLVSWGFLHLDHGSAKRDKNRHGAQRVTYGFDTCLPFITARSDQRQYFDA